MKRFENYSYDPADATICYHTPESQGSERGLTIGEPLLKVDFATYRRLGEHGNAKQQELPDGLHLAQALRNNAPEETAPELWRSLLSSAGFAFFRVNRSTSASLLCFRLFIQFAQKLERGKFRGALISSNN
jgi:hypothetical protein